MTHRTLVIALALLVTACSGPRLLNTVAPNPDRRTEIVRDITYGAEERQTLDLYIPRGEGPHPVLIFIHGGSWNSGSKGEYAFAGKRFAALGYMTAVINYRLAPDGRYPVFMEDAAAATAWLTKNVGTHGGDAGRLFVTGHSAGGYMAVQLAVAEEFLGAYGLTPAAIDGVAGIAGPYDFLPSTLTSVHEAFGIDADKNQTMPVYRVSTAAPPMLLLQGGKDTAVLAHNAPNLAAALRKVGVPLEIKTYPQADHDDTIIAVALGGRRYPVAQDIADFFGGLPPERLDAAISE